MWLVCVCGGGVCMCVCVCARSVYYVVVVLKKKCRFLINWNVSEFRCEKFGVDADLQALDLDNIPKISEIGFHITLVMLHVLRRKNLKLSIYPWSVTFFQVVVGPENKCYILTHWCSLSYFRPMWLVDTWLQYQVFSIWLYSTNPSPTHSKQCKWLSKDISSLIS